MCVCAMSMSVSILISAFVSHATVCYFSSKYQQKISTALRHVCRVEAGSVPRKVADYGLVLAVPPHAHIACNFIIADYVPRALQGAARFGMLGVSCVTAAGLLKMNLAGDGVTSAVQQLWRK